MPHKFLPAFLLAVLFAACTGPAQPSETEYNKSRNDTLVIREDNTKEAVGAAYLKKSTRYFLVYGKDTSTFVCGLSTLKDAGEVLIGFRETGEPKLNYRQKMDQLKLILPEAAKDFNIDSVRSVSIGQLIETGDLAIDITNQFQREFGFSTPLPDYKTVSNFLKNSKLGADMNNLFNPYHLTVDHISIEKLHYTQKAYLSSPVETDRALAPEQILNCTVWVTLKNSRTP